MLSTYMSLFKAPKIVVKNNVSFEKPFFGVDLGEKS